LTSSRPKGCTPSTASAAIRSPKESDTRIVSLLPSATEILFAVGAGDEVVGVTHECDYPPAALRLPRVTSSSLPNGLAPSEIDRHVRASLHRGSGLYCLNAKLLEALEPGLIITQELCPVCAVSYVIVDRAVKRMRTDTRVVSLEPSSLEDVLAQIRWIGEITQHAQEAAALIASLHARILALRKRAARVARRPRVLLLEWTDPPMSAGHWIPELLELAGGDPVLGAAGANSQRLEWSAIASADPDAVIVAPCGLDLPKTRRALEELEAIPEWNSLRARRAGCVLAMDGNAYVSRPGPRLVDSAEMMAQWYTTLAEHAG
jgi:iron complex transport system substrate-binding protein